MSHNGLTIFYPPRTLLSNPPPGADIARSLLPATSWQVHISQHRSAPFPEHPARMTFLEEATFAYLRLENNYLAKNAEYNQEVDNLVEFLLKLRQVRAEVGMITAEKEKLAADKQKDIDHVVQQRDILLKMLASKGETSESVQDFADREIGNGSIMSAIALMGGAAVASRHILDSLAHPNMMQGKILAKLKYGSEVFQELGVDELAGGEEKEEGEVEEGEFEEDRRCPVGWRSSFHG